MLIKAEAKKWGQLNKWIDLAGAEKLIQIRLKLYIKVDILMVQLQCAECLMSKGLSLCERSTLWVYFLVITELAQMHNIA